MPYRPSENQLKVLREAYSDGDLRTELPDRGTRFEALHGREKESLLRLVLDAFFRHYGGPQTAERVGVPLTTMYNWRGRYWVTV